MKSQATVENEKETEICQRPREITGLNSSGMRNARGISKI